MSPDFARIYLAEQLTSRYGEGEARAIARIVFEDAFDAGRTFDQTVFDGILSRLLAGEPVQYVMGEADFFGLKFKVSPAVLIPRQETEELVAWILEDLKTAPKTRLIDIGLGSGCIGITLKKKLPGLALFGLEKSPEALAVALKNAEHNLGLPISQSPNIYFVQGDILNPADWVQFPKLDVVVSNPPYIPHSEKHLVPEHVISHEPTLALFVDHPDPLLFYRVIADFALEKLQLGGHLYFECNEFNAKELVQLLREKGFSNVEIRKDLAGAERMLKAVSE